MKVRRPPLVDPGSSSRVANGSEIVDERVDPNIRGLRAVPWEGYSPGERRARHADIFDFPFELSDDFIAALTGENFVMVRMIFVRYRRQKFILIFGKPKKVIILRLYFGRRAVIRTECAYYFIVALNR